MNLKHLLTQVGQCSLYTDCLEKPAFVYVKLNRVDSQISRDFATIQIPAAIWEEIRRNSTVTYDLADVSEQYLRARARQCSAQWKVVNQLLKSSVPILPLSDFDEFVVNQTFVNNWDFIRDTLRPDYFDHFPEKLADRINDCVGGIAEEGIATLDEVAELAAANLRFPQAQILTGIHYLIASMKWSVDLEASPLAPFYPLKFFANP